MRNIEWLKEEVKKLEDKADKRNQFGLEYTDEEVALEDVKKLINQLDEPEVLSYEWIDEHVVNAVVRGGVQAFVHVDDLQNLLVPKQEEKETETVAGVLVDYLIASAKLKLALNLALNMEVKEVESNE